MFDEIIDYKRGFWVLFFFCVVNLFLGLRCESRWYDVLYK